MLVAHHEAHPVQATLLQTQEEFFPTRCALAVGQLHSNYSPPSFPIDPNRHQHRVALHYSSSAHLLIARIQDDIGVLFLQPALGKTRQLFVQLFVQLAHRAGAKLMPAELFTDCFDFTRRDPLHIHLH